jgi:hypothetical protein
MSNGIHARPPAALQKLHAFSLICQPNEPTNPPVRGSSLEFRFMDVKTIHSFKTHWLPTPAVARRPIHE